MTDERIKEARNKTAKTIVAKLLGSLEASPLNISIIETVLAGYEQTITRAAPDTEKPADDADAVVCRIEEIQHLLNDGNIMAKRHAQMLHEIVSYAESYHAARCTKCKAIK